MKKSLYLIVLLTCVFYKPVDASADQPALADAIQILKLLTTSGDPLAEKNVYLDQVVYWNPGIMGTAWIGNSPLCDDQGIPINNGLALGPPTGTGVGRREANCTAVGINGEAAFRFEEGYYIFNGPGDDFITFEGSFAWGLEIDGLCCELAHVEVSEDAVHWYYNSAEQYDLNPDPSKSNGDYVHDHVKNMHGNTPTFANHTKDMQAYEIQIIKDVKKWVKIKDVFISKDFKPTDPHLGGDRFDLSTFRSKQDDTPWPIDGKMRYVKIIDDDRVLDGQDYNKPWRLGAQIQAAMGIHVKKGK
jgi:hypothetical protein